MRKFFVTDHNFVESSQERFAQILSGSINSAGESERLRLAESIEMVRDVARDMKDVDLYLSLTLAYAEVNLNRINSELHKSLKDMVMKAAGIRYADKDKVRAKRLKQLADERKISLRALKMLFNQTVEFETLEQILVIAKPLEHRVLLSVSHKGNRASVLNIQKRRNRGDVSHGGFGISITEKRGMARAVGGCVEWIDQLPLDSFISSDQREALVSKETIEAAINRKTVPAIRTLNLIAMLHGARLAITAPKGGDLDDLC